MIEDRSCVSRFESDAIKNQLAKLLGSDGDAREHHSKENQDERRKLNVPGMIRHRHVEVIKHSGHSHEKEKTEQTIVDGAGPKNRLDPGSSC